MDINVVFNSERRNFLQDQGTISQDSEIAQPLAARKGEGHGWPESNQEFVRRRARCTSHKQIRRLTQRLRKRALSERKLIMLTHSKPLID